MGNHLRNLLPQSTSQLLEIKSRAPSPQVRRNLKDDMFVIRTYADMKSLKPEQPYDDIVGICREWDEMNVEHKDFLRFGGGAGDSAGA